MKSIVCDVCGKPILLKVGNLFVLQIQKVIHDIEKHPEESSTDTIVCRDYIKLVQLKKAGLI